MARKKPHTEDEGGLDPWATWLPDFLKGIEEGHYDGNLREIARAAFARRDTIRGTYTVVPDKDHEEVPPTVIVDNAGDIILGTNTVQPIPLPAGVPKPQSNAFEYDGKFYRKSDVLGRIVIIPYHSLRDGSYAGHKVRVTGVGPKRVKVIWLTFPAHRTTRMRGAFLNAEEVYMPRIILNDVLAP